MSIKVAVGDKLLSTIEQVDSLMILLYTPGLSWSIWFDAYLGLGAAALPQEELEGECTYAGVNFRKP